MIDHVVVIGAGPVGLVNACLLADAGISVSILEAAPELPRDLRASTFHPPTLDMLDRFGVVGSLIEQGLICPEWQFRDRKTGIVCIFELKHLEGDTAYPYRVQCEQWRLGEMLEKRLQSDTKARIRYGARATAVRPVGDRVEIDVTDETGKSQTVDCAFCIGADGIGSIVRQSIGARFDGITIPELYLTVSTTYDFAQSLPRLSDITYISDPDEWYVLIRTVKLWRALFPVNADLSDSQVTSPEMTERLLQGVVARREPYEVLHRTAYRVHERVASTYCTGRLVIAGDAAHVNNPLGGMGLNGGIHDAFNLATTLIEIGNGASIDLLGRYERQRRKVALDVVQQTALRNRSILNTREPAARAAYYQELRDTVADPDRHRDYLLRTSMIASLRDAARVE